MNTDKDLDMLLLRSQPRAASIKQYYDAATRLREPTIRLYAPCCLVMENVVITSIHKLMAMVG